MAEQIEARDRAAAEIIQCARAKVTYHRPYFGKAVYGVAFLENVNCPDMGVDEYWRCSYNPEWVKSKGIEVVTTAVLEKILHRVREHGERFRRLGVTMRTIDAAQAAACAEIQDDLYDELEKRRDLPQIPEEILILPSHFGLQNGEVAEFYYSKLVDRLGSPIYEHVRTKGEPDRTYLADPGKIHEYNAWKKARKCRCGSGATGVHMPWEHEAPAQGGPFGLEDIDRRDLLRQTAEDIVKYASRKGRGTVPGSLVDWAEDMLKPKSIPWEQIVGAAVRRTVQMIQGTLLHSYARPARRQSIYPDIVMPGMRRPVPNVAIVSDTSASMTSGKGSDLALVRGVIEDICRSMGANCAVIATDAEVHGGIQYVQSGRQAVLAGRGGTDMRVGMHYAMTYVRPRPDVLVVVTDCGTEWPDHPPPPPTRVLICGVGVPDSWTAQVPSWAQFINVDPRTDKEAA